ncbi:hypothetical protein ACFX2J_035387 [Malus domestica]
MLRNSLLPLIPHLQELFSFQQGRQDENTCTSTHGPMAAAAPKKKIPSLTKGIALSSHPKRLNVVISSRSQRGGVKKHATKCCSSSWEDTTLLSDPEKLAGCGDHFWITNRAGQIDYSE